VLESNFYAWRVTGDPKYLDRAKKAAENFREHLRVTGGGYAGLWDVDDVKRGQIDDTESFWYAEVLKYLYVSLCSLLDGEMKFFFPERYLTFDDPSKISLDKCKLLFELNPVNSYLTHHSRRLQHGSSSFQSTSCSGGRYIRHWDDS